MIQETKLNSIMKKHQMKWEQICYDMEHLEDNPLVLITSIFKGGDLFLAERLQREGEDVLLAAQEHWLQHLLPALTDYFAMDDIVLLYDEQMPLSPIYIQKDEQIVAHFSPYGRFFQTYEVPGMTQYVEERKQLTQEADGLIKELEHLQNIAENPALIGEEETWRYAKALMNPKKHKKQIMEQSEELEIRLNDIQTKVRNMDNRMEVAQRDYLEISYCIDRIKRKVDKWGDFTFYEPEGGMEE